MLGAFNGDRQGKQQGASPEVAALVCPEAGAQAEQEDRIDVALIQLVSHRPNQQRQRDDNGEEAPRGAPEQSTAQQGQRVD